MGNIYLENKFVESIIYDINIVEKLKNKELDEKLDINFLKFLNQYLRINKKHQTIDDEIKMGLYEIIRYIRFNMGQQGKKEYNEELNKAIAMINEIPQARCLNFYHDQMIARAHNSNSKNVKRSDKDDAASDPYMQKILRNSICYDYKVLCDLIKTPAEYKKEIEKYTGKEYGWFLCSIKGMNYENPKLFKNENIRNNVLSTITYNISTNELSENLKKSTEEINKNIRKR